MQPPPRDDAPPRTVLGYGTHDRAGPWCQRWLRAWMRAAKPALVVAAIVAALAYSVAPRQYTAEAIVAVEPDVVSAARGAATTLETDATRADALAKSLKNTSILQQVLNTPQWRTARTEHPGKTVFEPIDAEAAPRSKTVRIRFTDPNPEAARIGAEATVAVLRPIDTLTEDPATIVKRTLAPLIAEEQNLRLDLAKALEREGNAATQPATRPAAQQRTAAARAAFIRSRSRSQSPPSMILQRMVASASSRVARAERQLASTARITRVAPAVAPRFASNQKELALTGLAAAGLVFPAAFLVALYRNWRYRGATRRAAAVGRTDHERCRPGEPRRPAAGDAPLIATLFAGDVLRAVRARPDHAVNVAEAYSTA